MVERPQVAIGKRSMGIPSSPPDRYNRPVDQWQEWPDPLTNDWCGPTNILGVEMDDCNCKILKKKKKKKKKHDRHMKTVGNCS